MWYEGPDKYVQGLDTQGRTVDIASLRVGYWGNQSLASPETGQVYPAHIVAGVFDTWRSNFGVHLGVLLPQGTSFHFPPGQPPFLCRKQAKATTTNPNPPLVDVTNDPGSSCPMAPPGLMSNAFLDLGVRFLPANMFFEIVFELVTAVPITGEKLWGYMECTDGDTTCDHPVYVYPKSAAGQPSARLTVITIPPWISTVGVPYSFAVFTQDSGSGAIVGGTATIFNFDQQGRSAISQFPTNTPQVATFYYGYTPLPDGSVRTDAPTGVVNCPGYQQRDFPIPLKFSTF
jgi:hypothetical protein